MTDDSRFRDALSIIPLRHQEVFKHYFKHSPKKKILDETVWQELFNNQPISNFLNPSSSSTFEKNPFTYLINAHNSVIDFPSALNRLLKTLNHSRNGRILTKEQFLSLLEKVRAEADKKNWLTPALKTIFGALLLYPYASTKELAKQLRISENSVRYNIDLFRNRFILNKVIKWDYYKLGLSRIFLFLTFFDRSDNYTSIPMTQRYFETEICHKMDIARDIFSIQIFTPPKNRWKTYQEMCETRFDQKRVKWLTETPTFFYIDKGMLSYNLDAFDKTDKQWKVDEQYLDFCLSTNLLDELPSIEFHPTLTQQFSTNENRSCFDELDLKIIYNFYELEGNDNRFSTISGVAKHIGVAKQTVKKRLTRMLQNKLIQFFYISPLRLPRLIDVVLLTKDEKNIQDYLKIISNTPFAYHGLIRPYRKMLDYIGIYSSIHMPRGTNLSHILRDTILSRDDVLGYSSDITYTGVSRKPLIDYWNSSRNQWKWISLADRFEENTDDLYSNYINRS